jgi:hypothetical protein
MRSRRPCPAPIARSAFAGFRFPPDVILLSVRWYLRFGLSYRDVEELLTERGVEVDHVTIYRWVQRFAPLLADAARPCLSLGDSLGFGLQPPTPSPRSTHRTHLPVDVLLYRGDMRPTDAGHRLLAGCSPRSSRTTIGPDLSAVRQGGFLADRDTGKGLKGSRKSVGAFAA